ncbi:MAG: hypothetical protein CME65_00530 [Halobacteriovoraceae bacterium]|nr:hypothetical protein [Halobacteriovoraceae bacterium]
MKWLLTLILVLLTHPSFSQDNGPQFKDKSWIQSDLWKPVQKLIDEQKFKAARDYLIKNKSDFVKDEKNWTILLIQVQRLSMALGEAESSVENFKKENWPQSSNSQFILKLYYAQTLLNYYQTYSWEINQREQINSDNKLDLKKWSKEDIFREIQKTLHSVWLKREQMGVISLDVFASFIDRGNYPRDIRGTLRDAFTYFYASFLENTQFWSAAQNNDKQLLSLDKLLEKSDGKLELISDHPLEKINKLLSDLEDWHWRGDRVGALLEARFQKIRVLMQNFTGDEQKQLMADFLKKYLRDYKINHWWSEGTYLRALLVSEKSDSDSYIRARKLALESVKAHSKSLGAKRAKSLISKIEQPLLQVNHLKWDSSNRSTIEIRYKNWKKVYFRAYKFNPVKWFVGKKSHALPRLKEALGFIQKNKSFKNWSVDLPDPGDFKEHKKLEVPPFKEKGFYLVHLSADPSFKKKKNLMGIAYLNITDLHPVLKSEKEGSRLKVLNSLTGEVEPDVKVTLYELNWQDGIEKDEQARTDEKGELLFTKSWINFDRYAKFYTLEKKGDFLLNDRNFRIYPTGSNTTKHDRSLIFTDRSIYRPGQKIQFKVLAYTDRSAQFELPKPMVDKPIVVKLHDGNGEVVSEKTLKANKFGTVAGEFDIPKGRFLGEWRITTAPQGFSSIKVEEYKRPTFLVELNDALGELKFNKKASFKGNVKYYFGLPVKGARVKFLVKRTKNYPYWYWWWYPRQSENPQIVEQGQIQTDEKGEFLVSFTPRANDSFKGVTYNYSVEVEVLNEGGETASVEKIYQIGSVAVTASLEHEKVLFPGSEQLQLQIRREDLNGAALGGKANLKVFKLNQPNETLSPTEQALFYGDNIPSEFKTKDDLRRSRWQSEANAYTILKSWGEDKLVASKNLNHGDNGKVVETIKKLSPGAYRIKYATKDKYGGVFESQSEFIVLGKNQKLNLPFLFEVDRESAQIGDIVTIVMKSGFSQQKLYFELFIKDKKIMNEVYTGEKIIKYRIAKRDLGGISVRLYTVIDHQFIAETKTIKVPFYSKQLDLSWERIRKKIYPGVEQSWTLKIKSKNEKGELKQLDQLAEVLTYMFDKSLDSFTSHNPPELAAKPSVRAQPIYTTQNSMQSGQYNSSGWATQFYGENLVMDKLEVFSKWGIGGFGRWMHLGSPKRAGGMRAGMHFKNAVMESVAFDSAEAPQSRGMEVKAKSTEESSSKENSLPKTKPVKNQLRSNFSETAFFQPQLISKKNGELEVKFKTPDNLTSYNVWAIAATKDLDFGMINTTVEAAKDLMVRTYLPRFVREGDLIEVKAVVDNASDKTLEGEFYFQINDPTSQSDLSKEFKLESSYLKGVRYKLSPGKSKTYKINLQVPFNKLGEVEIKARAKTSDFSDAEVKSFPILPSRIHLAQSRFVTLKNQEKRDLVFKDMLSSDKSLIHDSLILKLDAQLFYSVLSALPYIVDYPYECSEQTVNKYVTTAILSHTYKDFPSVAKMAQKMSSRKTQYEKMNENDPNRKMGLEETPWLRQSRGEGGEPEDLLNMLKPRMVKYQKDVSLNKLLKLQYKDGGFSWFPGGKPSFYMTKYVLYSFAKASEFGVEVPKTSIKNAFTFTKAEFGRKIDWCITHESCWEWITFLNFIMSSYPDPSYFSHAFSKADREKMLNHSFNYWKKHSPQLKGMLALTLEREKRHNDAVLVLDSVMDSAREERDLGVFWAPEDRSWLWYNDTIETHSFALRALMEIRPKDERRHGLVQWLFLNKKLNHWKSTRATAEVMYSLLHYLKAENLVGSQERAKIKIGDIEKEFVFDPEEFSGKDNFVVVKGSDVKPKKMHKIEVEQKTKGMMFASATWHFSTEKLPEENRGDFFSVDRKYYKRVAKAGKMTLMPLSEGAKIEVGDQIEVQISIRSKHAAEYVHLRDPRPAGFEPESQVSGYKWDLGLIRYEEMRDSGINFFFENLPAGEFTLKHRMRANLAGKFRTHPATLQSVYAPEFVGYSSGETIEVK